MRLGDGRGGRLVDMDGAGEVLIDGDGAGEVLAEGDTLRDGDTDGDGDTLRDGETEGDGDTLLDGDGDGLGEAPAGQVWLRLNVPGAFGSFGNTVAVPLTMLKPAGVVKM